MYSPYPRLSAFLVFAVVALPFGQCFGDFQNRADAVGHIMTEYVCDLGQTLDRTLRTFERRSRDRIAQLHRMATSLPADHGRVPRMLDACSAHIGQHTIWMLDRQQHALRHLQNETRIAMDQVRYHIGYYIHLDALFPEALDQWTEAFERTTRKWTVVTWQTNNDTMAYHGDVFGQLLRLARRFAKGDDWTTSNVTLVDDAAALGGKYARTWQTLLRNAIVQQLTAYEAVESLLVGYVRHVKDVSAVLAKRLRKLNALNETCFCSS